MKKNPKIDETHARRLKITALEKYREQFDIVMWVGFKTLINYGKMSIYQTTSVSFLPMKLFVRNKSFLIHDIRIDGCSNILDNSGPIFGDLFIDGKEWSLNAGYNFEMVVESTSRKLPRIFCAALMGITSK